MYTHYTAAFWLLAGLGWLFWARPDLRRDALLANVGAAVLFLPWVSGVLADFDSPTTKILSELEPFTLDFVSTALAHWAIGFPYSVLGLDRLPGTLGLVLIISALGRGRRRPLAALPRRAAEARPAASSSSPPSPSPRRSARRCSAPSQPTSSAPATSPSPGPGLALLAAAFVTAAPRRLWIAPTALLLVAFAIAAVKMQGTDFERPKFEAAAEFVDAEAGPGDVVIDAAVFSPGPMSALDVWLDRGPPDPARRPAPAGRPSVQRLRPRAHARGDRATAGREAQGGRIVIVTNRVAGQRLRPAGRPDPAPAPAALRAGQRGVLPRRS